MRNKKSISDEEISHLTLINRIHFLERIIFDLKEVLNFYGNPETYHACAFLFDRPTGGFDEDFNEDIIVKRCNYDRPMPGKMAREALKKYDNYRQIPN